MSLGIPTIATVIRSKLPLFSFAVHERGVCMYLAVLSFVQGFVPQARYRAPSIMGTQAQSASDLEVPGIPRLLAYLGLT